MNIKPLFQKQLEKNSQLNIDSSLTDYKLSARKNLELYIKLSNLAEETKCYKYWTNDTTETCNNTIFKNYIDLLGQIITIGLDKNYINSYEVNIIESDYCLSDQFLNLFIDANDLIITPSEDHFQTLLEDFISIGLTLGYSEDKIINTFMIN